MMILLFLLMLSMLILAYFNKPRIAIGLFAFCLILACGWFLFLVHSDVYGFSIPWLKF